MNLKTSKTVIERKLVYTSILFKLQLPLYEDN